MAENEEEIKTIAAYDNSLNTFVGNKDLIEYKKIEGLALSYRDAYVNNDKNDDNYHVIIFCNGNRVKDISKDNKTPYGKRDYVSRIKEYFSDKEENVYIVHILLDNDAPLELETEMIAKVIDKMAIREKAKSIQYIGHSKAGVMGWNMPKYLEEDDSYNKLYMYLTAPPLLGCLIASKPDFLIAVKDKVDSYKAVPKNVRGKVYEGLVKYYESKYSNSHMDKDIAPLENELKEDYDPNFIKNTFSEENLNALTKIQYLHDFITEFDSNALKDLKEEPDGNSFGMFLMNFFLMPNDTDGFVELLSQIAGHKFLDYDATIIANGSHYFLASKKGLTTVLDVLYKQMKNVGKDIDQSPKLHTA